MTSDRTEQQSSGQMQSARDLSMKPKSPPAGVPGYTIESLLGTGAYGEVWLALDEKTGRRVAIKFYTRKTSLDFSLLSREVEKLVFLSADRYVVQLLDVGWDANPPYYVMDYIDNGSLEDELKRQGNMPVEDAVELIEEICIGLMHLHGKGILHCDLKPGNVLLDQDKKPRLADFGQSRLSHEQAPALGTLFFMAPEQADMKAAPDARWDVYALGALLFCLLTGEPPFRDEELVRKVESTGGMEDRLLQYRKLIQDAPQPTAHRKVAGVDRNLADIIDRCIERSPKKRFASIQSVYQALRQREHSHAKRPLIVLGLLGPLLLLAIMSLFGWNAYRGAISQTDLAIKTQTLETNQWVAQLAARSASEQIDNYFRVVKELTNDEEFQAQVARIVDTPDVMNMLDQLADPARNNDQSLDSVRKKFQSLPIRKRLNDRLQNLIDDPASPKAASWFVCDAYGTQIASVFETPNAVSTLGKNYSYRSYFTGRNEIAETTVNGQVVFDVTDDPTQRQHIEKPFMSAIFKSRATDTWKIAFAVPIYFERRFVGVAAVTENVLGSFVEFQDTQNQYVMLVDGRQGKYRGTILEHPLITRLLLENGNQPGETQPKKNSLPSRLFSKTLDPETLSQFETGENGIETFVDPMGAEPMGNQYDRQWLASWAQVTRRDSAINTDTGLRVIAVADEEGALQPSRSLGRQLARIGMLAVLFFLLVTTGLLYFVFQSLRRSRNRIARMLGGSENTTTATSGTAIHDAKTMIDQS